MKVIIFFILVLLSVIFNNCTYNQTGSNESNKIIDSLSFKNEYKSSMLIDTTLIYSDYTIKFSSVFSNRGYILPEKYLFSDSSKKDLMILKTFSSISINNNQPIIVDGETFSGLLREDDKQVVSYGVLSHPVFSFDTLSKYFTVRYSYSIPFTDLGKSATISFNVENNEVVKKNIE